MRILAIETSTARGSVALWEGGKVAEERVFKAPRGHNTAVFGALGEILEKSGSGADMIPSALAKLTAASKTGVWYTDCASMMPRSLR